MRRDNGGIGATGCLILLALAATFWAGIYCIVNLTWSHRLGAASGAPCCLRRLRASASSSS